MLGTRFGIGRSLLMLMLGLTLVASFTAPATAWAADEPPAEPENLTDKVIDPAKETKPVPADKFKEAFDAFVKELPAEVKDYKLTFAPGDEPAITTDAPADPNYTFAFKVEGEGDAATVTVEPTWIASVADFRKAAKDYIDGLNEGKDDADKYQLKVLTTPGSGEATILILSPEDVEDYALEFEVDADAKEVSVVLIDTDRFTVDNLWILIAGCFVFIMHLGFAMVESGLTRSKNTVNILFKNSMIICIGFLMYGLIGFGLHYPGFGEESAGIFGFSGTFIFNGSEILNDPGLMTSSGYALDMTTYADFFFQAMFCATGATIVSGAVCGRIKLLPFLLFTTYFTGIVYCVIGSWHWGGGVLQMMDTTFYDFAGSTVVHSVGGWGALMGAIVLGPRIGKYAKDGTVQPIPGHAMPLATIGVFLLWFGWFGFNGGSVLNADGGLVSLVLTMTTFAAAAGGLSAGAASWIFGGKPDLSMALNGILAGLVGITAGADQMNGLESIIIGVVAGVLVYFSVIGLDKLKIDDPVGAVSVHLTCGIWGTLVVGLLGDSAGGAQLMAQVKGIVLCGAAAAALSAIGFIILKYTIGLRVSEAEEIEGLDLGEHDMSAYPDFQTTLIKSYHAREI